MQKFNKILLVEDNQMISKICSELLMTLEELNCEVDIAESGTKALNLINDTVYDLILMDIGLPDMSGYELAQYLRSHNVDTPIVAVTGHSHPLDYEKAKKMGMNDMIIKPLSITVMKTFTKYFN